MFSRKNPGRGALGRKATDGMPLSTGMRQLQLSHGQTVRHRDRRGVTGEIKIMNGDFYVKWSDRAAFEVLNTYELRIRP